MKLPTRCPRQGGGDHLTQGVVIVVGGPAQQLHQPGIEHGRRIEHLVHRFECGRADRGLIGIIDHNADGLALPAVARIVKTIAVYDNFCHANDPYEEHDFGSFEADGYVIFFKIDYYSPDAADQSVTERVITIMLAEKYLPSA